MAKSKRIMSVFLTVIIVLGVIFVAPFTVNAQNARCTQQQAVAWLNAQGGKSYDFGNFTDGEGNYWGGTQCVEFVRAYVNWLVNGNPWTDAWGGATGNGDTIWQNALWGRLGWKVYYNTADFMPQPGDIFSSGGCHTGVVISSNLNTAVVADSNAGNTNPYDGDPVRIHTITWRSASSGSAYGATHFIRPNFSVEPPKPHTHNYNTYVYYWKSHPHYKCYKCSCGDIKENRNQTVSIDSCSLCHPVGKSTVKTDKSRYYEGETVTVSWNSVVNATHYNCWLYKKNSSGSYDLISRNDLLKSNYFKFYNLGVGSYKIYHVSYDSSRWKPDNSDWSYTISDNVFFSVNKKSTVQSIQLNVKSTTLGIGESYKLSKSVSPPNVSTNYTWSSSNTSVAKVSNGKVTAKKRGTAYITVKTSNGKTAKCKVTVKAAPKSVKIKPASVKLKKGKKRTISSYINSGSYANSSNIKWSTSNKKVAIVKGKGKKAVITAKSKGTAYIKIKLYNGKKATCKVKVK